MGSPWYSLMTNVAVVAFCVSVWTQLRDVFERFGPRAVAAGFGLIMGLGAIAAMVFPVHLTPGTFFDLRTCMLALAGFFGGPLSGAIALALAFSYRLWMGGPGAPVGLSAITAVTLLAVLGHLVLRRHNLRVERWHSALLAVATCAIGIVAIWLAATNLTTGEWLALLASRTTLLFLGVLLAGLALTRDEELRAARRENQTYRQVIDEHPDSISVSDLDGRFVIANPATASLLGAPSPADLIGRTGEQLGVPAAGGPPGHPTGETTGQTVSQQSVERPDGTTGWLQTFRVPLNGEDGQPIGVITHNRDITTEKQLQRDLDERQRVLSFALAQMSDGVAMFDRTGRLLFCNAQYRQLFPLTSDVRVPGMQIRSILATAVARREQQVGVPPDAVAVWIEEVAASMTRDSEEEVRLFDGSWLRVSNRPSPDGVSMVVVSDITRLKRTELELLDATERLRQEAATDAVTGLFNRRALDQRLEIEVTRSLRADSPISVVLLDIDHFKAYNDTYGHRAGDACLQAIAQSLGQVFGRPADLLARYGGAQFLVVLPEVDSEAADSLANDFRDIIHHLALPHEASALRLVTVSLGIASYAPGETDRSAADLVGHADEALYAAKSAGRDRVSAWRRRFRVVPRSLRVVH
jgi:diguanylate cyclase (GGDEF)-like protein/PAS domain S-box-containing protein